MNETNGDPNAERTKKEGQQRQFLSCRSCVCFQVFCLDGLGCEESKFDHERGFSRRHVIDVNTGEGPRERLLFPVTFMPSSCFAFPCLRYYLYAINKEEKHYWVCILAAWRAACFCYYTLHSLHRLCAEYKTLTDDSTSIQSIQNGETEPSATSGLPPAAPSLTLRSIRMRVPTALGRVPMFQLAQSRLVPAR